MFNMKTRPRFRYKIVNQATGEIIYGSVCQDFGKLINVNCSSYKLAQDYLLLYGYKLTKCNPHVLWGELKKGTEVLSKRTIVGKEIKGESNDWSCGINIV